MYKPKLTQALLATSLTLAFASTLVTTARAELVSEDVQADSITPDASGMQEEMVIIKKAPKRTVVRETALPAEPVAIQPVAVQQPAAAAQATATATATAAAPAAPAARPSVGSSLDQGVANKMDEVKGQFENALLRTLDRIKITVDDGAAPAAAATATATATAVAAPAPVEAPPAPVAPVIVKDSIINANAAPANYMTVESAAVDEDEEAGTSVARRRDRDEESFASRIRVAPVFGYTSLGSNGFYDISSSFTAGLNLEMEVAENFAAYLGYTFSRYDIGLRGYGGAYGGGYGGGYGGYYGYNPLRYNQNVFEAGGKFYLMPSESAFRVFVGGGIGLSKGYLNYGVQNPYVSYGYGNMLTDYEVSQWLGVLTAGAEFKVSRNIALGADFKYTTILSARENERLRNYAFFGGNNGGLTGEQLQAGNSIANEGFYSILGTVKVSF